MLTRIRFGSLLMLMGLSLACNERAKGSPPAASSSATPLTAEKPVEPAQETAPVSVAEARPAPASGTKETIENAVGLGCEGTRGAETLELLCRKKNGTGGRPVRALINEQTGEEVLPDEHGELHVSVPFGTADSGSVLIEWTDTKYYLRTSGLSAKLEWAAARLEHRRACAKVQDESRAVLSAAQKADAQDRVLAAETQKLPRFGVCYPAGMGSWALGLKALGGAGDGAARSLTLELELVRVSDEGKTLTAPFASFAIAPGGLALKSLVIYDYDGDGNDEVVVPYELQALPLGASAPSPPVVWSFSSSELSPYKGAPELGAGGALTEQLEFDMRPDLAGYGPFVAWLGADCGLAQCPARVTGPAFFAGSQSDGSFAHNTAAEAALRRACGKKPQAIVSVAAGKLNAPQTAKNLGCAKAYGADEGALAAELTAQRALICGEAASCPLLGVFASWARAAPPISLPQTPAK